MSSPESATPPTPEDTPPARPRVRRPGADPTPEDPRRIPNLVVQLRKEMKQAAAKLEFERAAELRDRIRDLEQVMLDHGIAGV